MFVCGVVSPVVCCAWCLGRTEDTATNMFLSRAAPRSPKVGSWAGEGTAGGSWRRGLQGLRDDAENYGVAAVVVHRQDGGCPVLGQGLDDMSA